MEHDEGHDGHDEGLSTGKKVVAGAALGVAVPAAVGVARKLIGGSADGDGERERDSEAGGDREQSSTARTTAAHKRRSTSASAAKGTSKSSSSSTRAASTKTRDQLYRQATRLKIEGRSRMTKAQLERAIERAKR
jgi:hypothetical protein